VGAEAPEPGLVAELVEAGAAEEASGVPGVAGLAGVEPGRVVAGRDWARAAIEAAIELAIEEAMDEGGETGAAGAIGVRGTLVARSAPDDFSETPSISGSVVVDARNVAGEDACGSGCVLDAGCVAAMGETGATATAGVVAMVGEAFACVVPVVGLAAPCPTAASADVESEVARSSTAVPPEV